MSSFEISPLPVRPMSLHPTNDSLTTHTVSQRGVVFFRKQDDINNDLQKQLVQRLGELSGKPESSKLHIHPVINAGRRLGGGDNEISVISSEQAKEIYKNKFLNFADRKQSAKGGWHSDITFEKIPSDYALLRLTELPKTGGGKSCPPQVLRNCSLIEL